MLLGTTLLSVASLLAKPAAEVSTAASVSIVDEGSEHRRWQAVRLICAGGGGRAAYAAAPDRDRASQIARPTALSLSARR